MDDLQQLVGSIRRLGPEGPPYEVVGPATNQKGEVREVRIRVIESDEQLDYPIAAVLADPQEA